MLAILSLMIFSATRGQDLINNYNYFYNPDAPFYNVYDLDDVDRPSENPPDSNVFTLPTLVYNAFPDTNVTAFVLFENDRISRLQYGQLYLINATYGPSSDFLIQFRQVVTDGKANNLFITIKLCTTIKSCLILLF